MPNQQRRDRFVVDGAEHSASERESGAGKSIPPHIKIQSLVVRLSRNGGKYVEAAR